MSNSYTLSETQAFTVTHARHMAAKVATDLKRIQRFYSDPSDTRIASYETEIIELLKKGYLATVTYGFRRDGKWIEPTLIYTARELAGTASDDDPGRIRPGANIADASFGSYLTHSPAWEKLSSADQEAFSKTLPFQRSGGSEPSVDGYVTQDRTYSSGGRALDRSSVRSY